MPLIQRSRVALTGALAALLAVALTTAPNAAVPGHEHIVATQPTPNNSLSPKSFEAACPSNKEVIGAGGQINHGQPGTAPFGQVFVAGMVPTSPLSSEASVTVDGIEDHDGTAFNWGVRASAICANALPGLTRAGVATQRTTDSPQELPFRSCPTVNGVQTRLVGLGAETEDADGQVVLDDVVPVDRDGDGAPDGARLKAFQNVTPDGPWRVRARLLCANPLPGLELVRADSAGGSNSSSSRSAHADCDPGKKVLGAGFEIVGGLGRVVAHSLGFSEDFNGDGVGEGATVGAVETQAGQDGNWSLRSYAVCATA